MYPTLFLTVFYYTKHNVEVYYYQKHHKIKLHKYIRLWPKDQIITRVFEHQTPKTCQQDKSRHNPNRLSKVMYEPNTLKAPLWNYLGL